jgi:hypothetical protein
VFLSHCAMISMLSCLVASLKPAQNGTLTCLPFKPYSNRLAAVGGPGGARSQQYTYMATAILDYRCCVA